MKISKNNSLKLYFFLIIVSNLSCLSFFHGIDFFLILLHNRFNFYLFSTRFPSFSEICSDLFNISLIMGNKVKDKFSYSMQTSIKISFKTILLLMSQCVTE